MGFTVTKPEGGFTVTKPESGFTVTKPEMDPVVASMKVAMDITGAAQQGWQGGLASLVAPENPIYAQTPPEQAGSPWAAATLTGAEPQGGPPIPASKWLEPFVQLPRIRYDDPRIAGLLQIIGQQLGVPPPQLAAGVNVGTGFAEGAISPIGIATAPFLKAPLVQRGVGLGFGALAAEGGGQQLGEASVTKDPQAATEGVLNTMLAPWMMYGGLRHKGEVAPAEPEVSGAPQPGVRGGFVPTTKQPGIQLMLENLRNIFQVASGEEKGRTPYTPPPPAIPPVIPQTMEVPHAQPPQQQEIKPSEVQARIENQPPPIAPRSEGAQPIVPEVGTEAVGPPENGPADVQGRADEAVLMQPPREWVPAIRDPESQKVFAGPIHGLALDEAATFLKKSLEDLGRTVQSGWQDKATGEFVVGEKPTRELPKETPEDLQAQLAEENPMLPEAEAPKLVRQLNKLRLSPDREGFYNTDQLLNTLRNKLHPDEWKVLEEQGVREAFGQRVKGSEVEAWLGQAVPKVEVRKFGEGGSEEVDATTMNYIHELETRGYRIDQSTGFQREQTGPAYTVAKEGVGVFDRLSGSHWKDRVPEADRPLIERVLQARPRESEQQAHWQSIAPKGKMEGYVEGAVVVPKTPFDKTKVSEFPSPKEIASSRGELFPSTHSFPPNTLGFFRGYMETLPNGKKVFHLIEAQSDWAAARREAIENMTNIKEVNPGDWAVVNTEGVPIGRHFRSRQEAVEQVPTMIQTASHPLLKHWERLTMKAAIEHAKKEGADYIAVQDAASAMLQEGHDAAAFGPVNHVIKSFLNEKDAHEFAKEHQAVVGGRVEVIKAEGTDYWHVIEGNIPQEPGMRLHYGGEVMVVGKTGEILKAGFSTKEEAQRWAERNVPRNSPDYPAKVTRGTLQDVAEELTGQKGERVVFGEHVKAFEQKYGGPTEPAEMERLANQGVPISQYDVPTKVPRKDLILREPTGELKTTVSARMYPLEKARGEGEFTLFGKDRPVVPAGELSPANKIDKTDAAMRYPELSDNDHQTIALMGLDQRGEGNLHVALSKLASRPDVYGPEFQSLAGFLTRHFEEPLKQAGVTLAKHPDMPRGAYMFKEHKVYLDAASGDWPVSFEVLHEAAHAATWWALEHPMSAIQWAGRKKLIDIMESAKSLLSEDMKKLIGEAQGGYEYNFKNLQEFVAGIFTSPGLRRVLNKLDWDGSRSFLTRAWEVIKEVLGIRSKSALAEALDTLAQVGDERIPIDWARKEAGLHPVDVPQRVRNVQLMDELIGVSAPAPGGSIAARQKREALDAFTNRRLGRSAPNHLAASPEVANWLVRYASSRIAAPEVAKWMATDVLGVKWKDPEFSRLLGATLVEDRLRAVRATFQDMANKATDPAEKAKFQTKADSVTTLVGQPYSPFKTEADFMGALRKPDMIAAILRHRNTIQPFVEKMHKELQGKTAEPGENTRAFVNLRAILAPEDVESARSMIFGSRQGNLANPLKKGSVFAKHAQGTGWMYETDYRKIAERMVRGNYEQYALRKYYEAMVAKGLAVEEKPGVPVPTTSKGEKLVKVEVQRKGTGPGMTQVRNLWVRPDLARELYNALQTDQPTKRAGLSLLLDLATDFQVFGPTDFLWHGANMFAVVAGSHGAARGRFADLYDSVRKAVPPVALADGLLRLSYNFGKVMRDSPEFQRVVAQFSEVGAGRAKPEHRGGMMSKLVTAATGIPIETTRKFDPFYYVNHFTSALLRKGDLAGRYTLNKMYDALVERGMAKDAPEARREFINRMGQYNQKLMPYFEGKAREWGLSPFMVAGKNMNRQAMQRLMGLPEVMAANPGAFAKMWGINLLGAVSSMVAFPFIVNWFTVKNIYGRPGTPFGAIDTGKDDAQGRPRVIDLLQLLLLRRAMRITGISAAATGTREKLPLHDTVQMIANAIFGGVVHPWAGPPVRLAWTTVTGREPGLPVGQGYLLSRNPDSLSENMWAAAKMANPTMAAMFKGHEEDTGAMQTAGESLLGAVGWKKGRAPSFREWMEGKSKELGAQSPEGLTLGQRRRLEKEWETQRAEHRTASDLSIRAAGERNFWKDYERQDALRAALPKDQQQWLESHKLHLPGFEAEVTATGVKLPTTREESEFMAKRVAEEYGKVINAVMQTGSLDRIGTQLKRQQRLNEKLAQARAKARSSLRRRVASPSE